MGEFAVVTEIRDNPRVVCVRTTGYIDDAAGEKIKKVIQSLMVKGEKNYLFNFASSPVINSTGISCLLEICEEIGFSLQGKVVFCSLPKAIAEVFKMMGITTVYTVCDSEESAVPEFSR
ncbi:MAG: STAS domain-containing protein [Candidatus Riflebacteria bacterium]|nr:STAS domain-containing protein [Candidatus Riflebacteria bacterium]